MKIFLILLTLLTGFKAMAQPGYVKFSYNLNDLPESYAAQNLSNPRVYRLTVVIDETTKDFSRLDLLKNHKELYFEFGTKNIPEEFNTIVFDSLVKVNISCSDITTDLSNIIAFKHTKELSIQNFAGNKIPDIITDFGLLESLQIKPAGKINNIDALRNMGSLKFLSIDCTGLRAIPRFSDNVQISYLELDRVHYNLDFTNLNTLKKLSRIEITIADKLKEFPGHISGEIKHISVSGNLMSLSNLNRYQKIQYLSIGNTELEKLDIDFKANAELKNIMLQSNLKMKNIDAVYSCTGLEYLLLAGLPALKEFDLKNLNLIKGLTVTNTGIESLQPNDKLEKLPYLYIKYNDYLKIDLKKTGPKRDIFENGRLRNSPKL